MKEFTRIWSNWWILNPKRKQLDDAFEKELNELIEREVALRIHDVVGRSEQLCPNCYSRNVIAWGEKADKCQDCELTWDV
jgi:tRNA(Ile2) C34 agmatinyltransferase TiaS